MMAEHIFNWTVVAQHFPDLAFRLARIQACQHFLLRGENRRIIQILSGQLLRRLLVGDAIDFVETVVERSLWDTGIMFATREAFFLHCRNQNPRP